MKIVYRIVAVFLCLLAVFGLSFAVLAISNPDTIAFGSGTVELYNVFENVAETGDMLFMAEGFVYYAAEPTDYSASEAFMFQILNTSGNVTYLSVPLNDYGDRPISIYQTAEQVTALGLTSGTAYGIRIMGNPTIFPSQTGNTVSSYLTASDYIDQSVATDDNNPLRDFVILMAQNMEDNDAPASDYLVDVQGTQYLTPTGGNLFLEGVPGLYSFCPVAFQTVLVPLEGDVPSGSGAYAASLTVQAQWGQTIADGLTQFGSYLGINQALAGSVVFFGLAMAFAVFVYKKTESGLSVLLLLAAMPFMGAWLGLMPMALAFILVIFVIVLGGYFFFSRGAL